MIADDRVAVSECIDDGRRDIACRSGPDAGHNDSCLIHLGVVKIYNLKTKNGGAAIRGLRPSVADANSIIKALQPSLARGSVEPKPYSNGDNIDHCKYYY